jgi:hypothetical protein
MAAEDFAILMGISLYADPLYPKLGGPVHDVELMKAWLTSPTGGNMPATRIETIVSPNAFPNGQDPFLAPPLAAQFDAAFLTMERERVALKETRVNARLYLYFSGHGFSSREIKRGAEAALYAANAAKDYFPHVYGTYFAYRAVEKALFKEIVLIMDCCRDAEANRSPIDPTLPNTPDYDMAGDVRLLTIYAVPRGGKAQERAIPDRKGQVHGLLTHALVKTFEEARPTEKGQISATRLRDHLKQSWDSVCGGDDAPPAPKVYLPTSEMFFTAKNVGIAVKFSFATPQLAGAMLVLRDDKLKKFAHLSVVGVAEDDLIGNDSPILKLERTGTTINLRMLPGFYDYELTGAAGKKAPLKVETGDVNVDL